MKSKYTISIFSLLFIFIFVSCPNFNSKSYCFYFDEETFEKNCQKWQAKNIKNYSFKWSLSSLDTREDEIRGITIVSGGASSVELSYDEAYYTGESPNPAPPSEDGWNYIDSIEKAIATIKSSVDFGKKACSSGLMKYYNVSITYNGSYSFPMVFKESFSVNSEWDGFNSDGLVLTVYDFTML